MTARPITQYEPEPPASDALHCTACGQAYSTSEARVQKALRTHKAGDAELAALCWICVRLRRSVDAEAAVDKKTWGCAE
jgi:hypothetical protein